MGFVGLIWWVLVTGYGPMVYRSNLVGKVIRHGGDVGLIWWVLVVLSKWC